MWVRGLKLKTQEKIDTSVKSHPMWVRGLKLRSDCRDTSAK